MVLQVGMIVTTSSHAEADIRRMVTSTAIDEDGKPCSLLAGGFDIHYTWKTHITRSKHYIVKVETMTGVVLFDNGEGVS